MLLDKMNECKKLQLENYNMKLTDLFHSATIDIRDCCYEFYISWFFSRINQVIGQKRNLEPI